MNACNDHDLLIITESGSASTVMHSWNIFGMPVKRNSSKPIHHDHKQHDYCYYSVLHKIFNYMI